MAVITGTSAADTLPGTAGTDEITGGPGNDLALMGAGNDVFIWNPGDASDMVEGQGGLDTLRFNGANGAEAFEVSANGARARLTRNIANVVMDLNDVERIELRALGGADTITVADLTGTDVKRVAIELAAAGGAGDGQGDTVIVNGSGANNTINVALVAGAVSVAGLPAQTTIAGAEAIDDLVVNGQGGHDTINASKLGADALHLTLDGGLGNDRITGGLGNDILLGGDGNDTVAGGTGNDIAFLGAGNDLFQWNPGDGSDTIEGQEGFDTLRFAGSSAGESIDIAANGGRALLFRDVDAATLDLDDVERLEVRALGGADTITIGDLTGTDVTQVAIDLSADGKVDNAIVSGTQTDDIVSIRSIGNKIVAEGLAAEITINNANKADALAINGLGGNDIIDASGLAAGRIGLTISGGLGVDLVLGSAGNDTVNGGDGDDIAFLGGGNDVFVWNPGDDNDTVEGQGATDTLRFNGANVAENIDIGANGGRAQFFRNVANVVLSLNDVERIEFQALGGADTIAVSDLSGTDVKQVALNLAAAGGGDGLVDSVIRAATAGDDSVNVALAGGLVSVTGLSAQLTIAGAESTDVLTINGLAGDDKLNASKLPAGNMDLVLDGGIGNDTIVGSADTDVLLGGDGNDLVTGGGGDDIALLGAGDDLFLWNSGDGSDTIEGQNGLDALRFTGANADENIDVSANGGRGRLFRDVAAVIMDLDDVERLELRTLGGVDNIVIHDLTGTDVTEVAIDLAAAAGGKAADSKIDTVTVNATGGDDVVAVSANGSKLVVTGLTAQISIDHAGKTDRLVINALGGDDVIDASSLAAGKAALTMNGGLGADVFLGSAGNDTVSGGDGDDLALLGAGNDLFIWNPGDDNDTIEGQAGTDTLLFNGANVAETIDIAANGGRVVFFRNIANVLMDLNDVERIQFNALGGADNITVNDLSGTDLKQVAVDLGAAGGGGDGQVDTVIAHGTAGNDKVTLSLSAGALSVTGLQARVTVEHGEVSDRLSVFGDGGNDTINAAAVPASAMALTLDGGAGNDVITGSAGHDAVNGGLEHDILNGGAGNDTLLGGTGNDTINGGIGDDTITGGIDSDTINVSSGNDTVRYTSVLDGHDVITGFDGNAAGGQDTLDLDALFDNLLVPAGDRAGRVSIVDTGASVEIAVDADGNLGNGFELALATLKTSDAISIGQDVLVGS